MSNGSTTWNYEYNADGLRTKRTNGTNTYYYYYAGGQLLNMRRNYSFFRFAYDASGAPMTVIYGGETYFYVTNIQGDMIAILDDTGATVVEYTYDAWGNVLTTTGSMASTLGTYNPLRYRGYVYDEETGVYYLQSRYYTPSIGRFINADAFASTGQGLLGNNMFAYCLDNPINYLDEDGEDAIWIQEKNSAFGCGHSGLMVQDEEGNWWYFYWGPSDPDSLFSKVGMVTLGTDVICVFMKVNVAGYNIDCLSGVRGVLLPYNDARVGEQADDITNILYYKGDYTNTYNFLCNLSADANDGSLEYHLLTENCSIMSVTAMQQSSAFNHKFRVKDVVIPNLLYRKLARLHQWSGGVGSRSNTKVCI